MKCFNYHYMKKNISEFRQDTIAFVRKRLKEMGLSMAEAERLSGVPDDTIVKLIKGHGTSYENYVAIMKRLRYSIPLYGKLISGGGVETIHTIEDESRVQLHEGVEYSPDLLAIVVDDDKYEPRYFKGTTLFFKSTTNKHPKDLASKHPYLVKIKNGKTDLMIVRPGSKLGVYNLLTIDGSSQILSDIELEWCAPIEGTKWEY